MAPKAQQGYLVLADISGFTSFLKQVELDHAHEVLADLLEVITKQFRSLLSVSKLEGDAVFAYAPVERIERGEMVLELVESTYSAFRKRVDGVHRRTVCECNACRCIPSLDLKFLAHVGTYIAQPVAGTQELLGSDINLVHRLLKNRVTETTGWRAYALFTQTAVEKIGVPREEFVHLSESYEHLGDVDTFTMNIRQRYDEMVAAQQVLLTKDDAHITLTQQLPAPPPVVWDWFNDPRKRGRWSATEIRPLFRPGGRLKVGAQNHCVHGKDVSIETILDWRPFEYFTVETAVPLGVLRSTYLLSETPEGTTLEDRTRFQPRMRMLSPFGKPIVKLLYKIIRADEQYRTLARALRDVTNNG